MHWFIYISRKLKIKFFFNLKDGELSMFLKGLTKESGEFWWLASWDRDLAKIGSLFSPIPLYDRLLEICPINVNYCLLLYFIVFN